MCTTTVVIINSNIINCLRCVCVLGIPAGDLMALFFVAGDQRKTRNLQGTSVTQRRCSWSQDMPSVI